MEEACEAIRVFRAVVLLPCTGGSQGTAAVLDASVIACHPLPGSALYLDTARGAGFSRELRDGRCMQGGPSSVHTAIPAAQYCPDI